MNKMWKSDGEEQQQLEKLFREKEVNCASQVTFKKNIRFSMVLRLMFSASIGTQRN